MKNNILLEVRNLHISFSTYAGTVQAVRGVDFSLNVGETLAIVGESGCGKTVTVKSIVRLLPQDVAKIHGDNVGITLDGEDLLSLEEVEMSRVRGKRIAMIFQDPMSSLNPTMKIGDQIGEVLLIHKNVSKNEARLQALELLQMVNIPNAEQRIDQYPFEFSGGMLQRVMIATAIACDPEILIADEPTTALDVTIQAQIIELIKNLQRERDMGVILVTHDLGVVASMADRIFVMYAGQIVERGAADEIFYSPKHPYTLALLKSVPKLTEDKQEPLYSLIGTPPDLINPPHGCSFAPRCEFAMKICRIAEPSPTSFGANHESCCWLHHPKANKSGVPEILLREVV